MVAIINVIEPNDLLGHVQILIGSLSRFTDDKSTPSILKSSFKGSLPDYLTNYLTETQEIAEEGLKIMQTKLGTTVFVDQLNIVRKEVFDKKVGRRMKRSLETVTNPGKMAKLKRRHAVKVKATRKRKILEFRKRRLVRYGK
jgi:hypothetical protein